MYAHGFTLYWGDAEAHLNIARRIVESRKPGYEQLGSPWLPLPHLVMLPFVVHDTLWRSGLAGSIPNALCFTAAAALLFASLRRIFGVASAWCGMALFVLNPNALYLQSIPMTEAVFCFTLIGLLFFTTRYRDSQSILDLLGASVMCTAASLTKYEGWILIPLASIYILLTTGRHRILLFALFGSIASIGAAWWLFYNWTLSGNFLDFYSGPSSAIAIQRGLPYPGHGDWKLALQYFFTAAKLVNSWTLMFVGGAGVMIALFQRKFWPVVMLAAWPFFIVWSMHSAAQPIFLPPLPPFSWYNTRYALAMLPLLVFGAGALASLGRKSVLWPVAIILVGSGFWLFHASHENWITWKESEQNSVARRRWTHLAAAYLKSHTRPTDTFFTSFGDISAIFREAGIHFKRTLTWDDFPQWDAAVHRPDLFLWEDWAVAQCGDSVDDAIHRARQFGINYDLAIEISVPDALSIEIYRRHEHSFR